ncbi:hypothetical protein HMPREF3227_02414 [Corynebacterium sp. CMW7794]|uniref:DUF2273 domain-containing protein n=1 Tax=Corynebacterium phoceense TaxID=1686286 RepID=A0A540R4I5_9CORY|nr:MULTISPECIES: hypothetical protein [Corynebacterium]KXB54967.1 hypothetical protein HMPREF0307_01238 [Corynebacterium sp. DNF00584]KXI15542.1 hypothetical protein HMPREF3227_02414 [Corynebacterium sp. CMW7794]MBF9010118.1 hypothetical protein [Corynebacterium phoceense]MCQ9331166.1 hypothetical protein [Corynebacterium phoceense]MCQ9340001.1 hypothetical protein [Corynebacterium phoceense]
MKNYTTLGIVAGIALAFLAYFGGWQLLLLSVVLAVVGGLAGAHFDGKLNVLDLWNQMIGKGRG